MLLKITRILGPEEIEGRIKKLEREHCMSFEKFEELSINKKLDTKLAGVYFEWAELVNSFKAYVEDGQLDYTVEEIKDFDLEQVALLTPKRIQLLYDLSVLRVESINDLAQKVKRNVKNVYEDLMVLKGFGFVKIGKRKGGALIPETLVKEITFLIS